MNPTNEQELRELAHIIMNADTPYDAMQFVKDHTNAEIARTLDRLEQEVKITIYDGDDSFGKEYQAGYNAMTEAARIYQLGIMSAIQAERAKLKEVK